MRPGPTIEAMLNERHATLVYDVSSPIRPVTAVRLSSGWVKGKAALSLLITEGDEQRELTLRLTARQLRVLGLRLEK